MRLANFYSFCILKQSHNMSKYVHPLYETADIVTGKLAVWNTPIVIKIKINDEWGGLTKNCLVSVFFDISIENC